jgi:hypothetical protein
MSGTDDFNAVVENEHPDGRFHQIVQVNKRINQQFLKHHRRNFRNAESVAPLSGLHFVQIAQDKCQRAVKYFGDRPGKVLEIDKIACMNGVPRNS